MIPPYSLFSYFIAKMHRSDSRLRSPGGMRLLSYFDWTLQVVAHSSRCVSRPWCPGWRIIPDWLPSGLKLFREGVIMYDELLLELDLCILAYQVHSQSLIWPTDPYCEQLLKRAGGDESRRRRFRAEIRATFSVGRNVTPPAGDYRGPGCCIKWAQDNTILDAIISQYDRINPWVLNFSVLRGAVKALSAEAKMNFTRRSDRMSKLWSRSLGTRQGTS